MANADLITMDNQKHLYKDALKSLVVDHSTLKMDNKCWYPDDIVFELMMPKELLKKNASL